MAGFDKTILALPNAQASELLGSEQEFDALVVDKGQFDP